MSWSSLQRLEGYSMVYLHVVDNRGHLHKKWRANGRDLDIYVEKLGAENCCPPVALMKLLVRHSSQWRALLLRIPRDWCSLLSKEIGEIADLTRLTTFTYDNSYHRTDLDWNTSSSLLNLTRAPNLRDITIGSICYISNVVLLPEKQITSLSLLDGTEIDLRYLLKSLSNVTEAHMSNISPVGRMGLYFSIYHCRMRTLHLTFHNWNSFVTLLMSLWRFPSLQNLTLNIISNEDSVSETPLYLLHFVSRSQCKLTHLYLNFILPDDVEILIELLSTLKLLEVLEIKNRQPSPMKSGDALFGALRPAPDPLDSLVPILREFTYEGPLTQSHLETLLEVMILRATRDTVTEKLDKFVLKSTVSGILGSVQWYIPSSSSPIPLNLHSQLRDLLTGLVHLGVFALSTFDGKAWTLDGYGNMVYLFD
ncbi:hypothetical protein JR316_0012298 [Psilocybe cubensis]|uniref:Uncharacterized protein n=2 Tax=Psilocybe cubensis TaxID=181762 RepID=A0A8H7XR85_PSICU|nr:hypothetical protein JR316_0012298 [Psilocybe cubensis]KAH9475187.1 hypothetical protein JR316_0012298 [Psilocybe cubensis]